MDKITIKSNHHIYDLKPYTELPVKERKWFGYIEDAFVPRFVCYKGNWYDVHDMMRSSQDMFPEYWHGYLSDSFFSGILVRFEGEDPDQVVMGTYYS